MRDVVIWCWGAFVMFGAFATYNQTFYKIIPLAALLAVFSTIAAIGAVMLFVWKIQDHWNCEVKS